jgi:hypothetical protein
MTKPVVALRNLANAVKNDRAVSRGEQVLDRAELRSRVFFGDLQLKASSAKKATVLLHSFIGSQLLLCEL